MGVLDDDDDDDGCAKIREKIARKMRKRTKKTIEKTEQNQKEQDKGDIPSSWTLGRHRIVFVMFNPLPLLTMILTLLY